MRRKASSNFENPKDSKIIKNERDAEDKRVQRSVQQNKQEEQKKEKERKQKIRQDMEKRNVLQQRDTKNRRHAREIQGVRDAEQLRDTERRRQAREDEAERYDEQLRDTERRRQAREIEAARVAEQLNDTKRRRQAREIEATRNREQEYDTLRRRNTRGNKVSTYEQALATFRARNKEGPTHVCLCCGGLFFQKAVTNRARETLIKAGCTEHFLQKVIVLDTRDDTALVFCSTCCTHIQQSKVPKRSLSNGLAFPNRPEELSGLSLVEEILTAPRCAFMMIRQLGWDGQYGLKGNIVNIPIDINETEKILPRKITNSSVVHLALMRKIQYKHPYLYETIRPKKVYDACKYLVTTPVYKEQGITLSEEWNNIDSPAYFHVSELPLAQVKVEEDSDAMEINPSSSDEDSDHDEANSRHPEQTMLIDDSEYLTHAIKHAPGEGQRPISLLWDLNAEVLTFPSIYCGQRRNVDPRLTYSDIAKSEALNYDRRSCLPNKVLYMFKKSQLQQVVDSITLSLRKRSKMQEVTAGNLLDPEYVTGMEHRNEGYKILKNIRSSPAYWEARKKELFATIRQLGIPTFFHTVSALEIQWPELLVILKKILDEVIITEEEAEDLPKADKTDLIRRDPITCARYFDAKTQDYFNIILKSKAIFTDHPLEDYFMRVEFQHRGSPHLIWLKNAPMYSPDDPFYSVPFIDQYITTARTEESVHFQHHRHTHCCRRIVNNVHICRFGIPYPPMLKTQILTPLGQEYPEGERVLLKNELNKIKTKLKEIEDHHLPNISYNKFLEDLNLTEENYFLAIRSNIKRPTIFLQREVESAFINAYNDKLLRAWRSNMDIQFVLDPYACAKYLSQYISKSYRGMSTLLRRTMSELQRGNLALKAQLRTIGSVFVNKSEVSAQEAAFGILGLSLSRFSRDHIYLNTGVPEERSRLTKSKEELLKMDPNDTNVIVDGLLEHYINRSNNLGNLCFADYAAWFNFKSSNPDSKHDETSSPADTKIFLQLDGKGYVKKRQFAKVIRYRRYGEHQEPFMFHREQVMLYYPWRDEDTELNTNPGEIYVTHGEVIRAKALEYNKLSLGSNMDELCQKYEAEEEKEDTLEMDEENRGLGPTDQNIFDDKKDATMQRFLLPGILPQSEYEDLMDSLNQKQRNYLLHVIHAIKSKRQILEYLSGGAGVGKSTTVRAIVQALSRYFLSQPGAKPDLLRVLVCAPTGIAAYNIEGKTLHSAFVFPYNQSNKGANRLRTLDPDARTRIASNLIGVKLVICDELSMVSSTQLGFINQRLQEYFQSNKLFGGHSLIFVGDLWQLPPIGGSAIFAPIKNDISSLAGTTLWDNFRFYELDQIMRQQGDPTFAQALNRMKVGLMNDDDIKLLKSREVSASNQPPENVIWLFHHRKKVRDYNEAALAKNKEVGLVAVATDKIEGQGEIDENGTKKLLNDARNLDYQDAQGLPYEILLKKSIRYMITTNVHNDLANGAIGILRHVTTKNISGIPVPSIVWLEFPEQGTGLQAREAFTGHKAEIIDPKWTPIIIETKTVKTWEGKQVRVIRKQFPLTPAEAITIYKSQSQSFTQMVLTLHPGITRSLLYVGCSRARSSSGLWINGIFVAPKPVYPTNSVYQAYEELRERPVLLSHLPTPAPREGMNSIIFYNVEHYRPHAEEVSSLLLNLKPSIAVFVETYTWPNFKLHTDHYQTIYRTDINNNKTTGYGSVCLANQIHVELLQTFIVYVDKDHVELTAVSVGEIIIVYGYATPHMNIADLEVLIKKMFTELSLVSSITILIGDFNKDLNSSTGQELLKLMNSLGLTSQLPTICSTTRAGTQIDCVFSGIEGVEAYISTSLTSHHDPLIVFWPSLNGNSIPLKDSMEELFMKKLKLNLSEEPEESNHINITANISRNGLRNPPGRNICFANAAIQALIHTSSKILEIQLSENCVYQTLLHLIDRLWNSESPGDVTCVLEAMTDYEFANNIQHDSLEFLESLLDTLNTDSTLYSLTPEKISSFRIHFADLEDSDVCDYQSLEPRRTWSMALPLDSHHEVNSLIDLLRNFLSTTISEPKTCQGCGSKHTFRQRTIIRNLPSTLIIHLGRFKNSGEKMSTYVQIPNHLEIPSEDQPQNYTLSAVIQHFGTSHKGHYMTACSNKNEWTIFDDSRVQKVTENDVLTSAAYILFYTLSIENESTLDEEPMQEDITGQ